MRKIEGSNLVEYVIPLVLIALVVGLGLYYGIASGSILGFASRSSNMSVDSTSKTGILDPSKSSSPIINPSPGSLNGSLDNPQTQCNNGVCVIDYGKYILTNIPQNFNDFIQTSGSSGGVKRIVDNLRQMANDLEDQSMVDLANEITNLANLGYNIALIMQEFENVYNTCAGDTVCISSYDNLPFPKPSGYNDEAFPFPIGATYSDMLDSGAFGAVINGTNTSPLAQAFVTQYNSISNNSLLDDSVKGVIQELSWNIGTVGQDFQYNYLALTGGTTSYFDPITGSVSTPSAFPDSSDTWTTYSASNITNYNSSLICAASYGTTTYTSCH